MKDNHLWSRLDGLCAKNYWYKRISGELLFLENVYEAKKEKLPAEIVSAENALLESIEKDGAVTKQTVLGIEEKLRDFSSVCKAYHVICAAHAHIDMNWEWGIEETVGTIIDTFQTMLNLLEEYPEYCFSQSQASVYHVIEKYCPSMLDEIRRYIKEGRWEVTASSWVENDKNMSGTEAQLRHPLYTKRYLSGLLGIDAASLDLDFEPDTFGHHANLPELLGSAGIKYYYHCRGYNGKCAYRFRAPSGSELLAYNEPNWYLGPIEYDTFHYIPEFCANNFTDTGLEVYGVGDHGGGPSRRDIERIMDMKTWPLMPEIRFGKIREFFEILEAHREELPVVDRELNCVFTGCYTSQSRIKQANRYSEDRLHDSEALCAMAQMVDQSKINYDGFEEAWRRVLFNQFHDILPGSGVRETRDYAMATASEACSYALANANRAMKTIGDAVDTSLMGTAADADSTAEGAGPGFGATKSSRRERLWSGSEYNVTNVGRSGGDVRPYTLLNPTQFDREEMVEITLWDWKYPVSDTAVLDSEGKACEIDLTEDRKEYWSHESMKIAFFAKVPAYGYANYYVVHADGPRKAPEGDEPRVHHMEDGVFVLENSCVRAEFETHTMKLRRFTEKETGESVITEQAPGACMYLIDESEVMPYNAWTIGNYGRIELINDTCFVDVLGKKTGGKKQWIDYQIKFRNSMVKVRVSLSEGSCMLRYSFEIDWNDQAIPGVSTPQLRFMVPYSYEADRIRYDIPGGYIDREKYGHDVPAIMYASPVREEGKCLMLTSDCKYGYRASENYLDINMIRSSYTPDLYPEAGIHQFEIGIGISGSGAWTDLREQAVRFAHPIYCYSNTAHKGMLPQTGSFLKVSGKVSVAAVKNCEDDRKACLIRLINGDKSAAQVNISIPQMAGAQLADTNEHIIKELQIEDHSVNISIPAGKVASVVVK